MPEKIIVRNGLSDLLAFLGLVSLRRRRIRAAPPERLPVDPVNQTVRRMHPETMHLRIEAVEQETETTRTYTLKPDSGKGTDALATFRAGQYLNLKVPVDGRRVTRNYSLSSTPRDAEAGLYRITVREKKDGYATGEIFRSWKAGTGLESSGPVGNFVYEPLRDRKRVAALAGGCGITPIYSIARDALERETGVDLILLYGVRNTRDIIFARQLADLERRYDGRLKVHCVASEPDEGWTGAKGFITAALVRELVPDFGERSFFVCGPQAMYTFLDGELEKLKLPRRLVRREVFGEADEPHKLPGFPGGNESKTFQLKVRMADEVFEVRASGAETILVALERAGLEPPSRCRSGECGFCRAKLLSGEVYASPRNDGRRIADRKFGWIHPCSSYPLSDLELRVSRAP